MLNEQVLCSLSSQAGLACHLPDSPNTLAERAPARISPHPANHSINAFTRAIFAADAALGAVTLPRWRFCRFVLSVICNTLRPVSAALLQLFCIFGCSISRVFLGP